MSTEQTTQNTLTTTGPNVDPNALLAQLKTATTEELKEQLVRSLSITAEHLQRAAAIYYELTQRGENLEALKSGLIKWLRFIAEGRLLPELVVRFAAQETLLNTMTQLPIPEQLRLLQSGTVSRVRLDANNEPVEETIPLQSLHVREIPLVFTTEGVRPLSDQIEMLKRKKANDTARGRSNYPTARNVRLDPREGVIVVAGSAVQPSRLLQLLSDHYGVDLVEMVARQKQGRAG